MPQHALTARKIKNCQCAECVTLAGDGGALFGRWIPTKPNLSMKLAGNLTRAGDLDGADTAQRHAPGVSPNFELKDERAHARGPDADAKSRNDIVLEQGVVLVRRNLEGGDRRIGESHWLSFLTMGTPGEASRWLPCDGRKTGLDSRVLGFIDLSQAPDGFPGCS
jgi:hypothetical protein